MAEPRFDAWRRSSLGSLVDELATTRARTANRPAIIAIDGRGGAGKSVLAGRLAAAVPASTIVATDDIAWHHSYFDWADLVCEHVLRPIHRGEPVDYRPPAWVERRRSGSIVVPAGLEVVWLEGTGASRRELSALLDGSIWVQVNADEAARRLIERDGSDPETEHVKQEWLREEEGFLLDQAPWASADLVVSGSSSDAHAEILIARRPR